MINRNLYFLSFVLILWFSNCSKTNNTDNKFKGEKHKLYLLRFYKGDPHNYFGETYLDSAKSLTREFKYYYTNDTNLISQFNTKIISHEANELVHKCDYNSEFVITNLDTLILQMDYSSVDKQIVINYKPFIVDTTFFEYLCEKMEPVNEINYSFKTLINGRKYYKSIMNDTNYLKIIRKDDDYHDWVLFEGEFYFRYKYEKNIDYHVVKDQAEKEIKLKYKNDRFRIYWKAYQKDDDNNQEWNLMKISCDKVFYNKFTDYIKYDWEDFKDFSFKVYQKQRMINN